MIYTFAYKLEKLLFSSNSEKKMFLSYEDVIEDKIEHWGGENHETFWVLFDNAQLNLKNNFH